MPKQSESRIILPQRVAQGQPVSAIWANQIREAIWRLTMRYGSDATGPTLPEYHPFKIVAWYDASESKTKFQVGSGAFTENYYTHNGTIFVGATSERSVKMGTPTGSDIGLGPSAAGVEIDDDDEYGVWIVVEVAASSGTSITNGTPFFTVLLEVPVAIASANAPEKTQAADIGADSPYTNFHAFYLGKITVNENGIPFVEQYRKSDIEWQGSAWFQPRVVSAQEGNSITTGSDGGAYYQEPEEE
jgi:hypothetical protein